MAVGAIVAAAVLLAGLAEPRSALAKGTKAASSAKRPKAPKAAPAPAPEAIPAPAPAKGAAARLGAAHEAFRDGRYDAALKLALPLATDGRVRNTDYALYIAAQSAFFTGDFSRALELFGRLAGQKASRFAALAPWRAADSLWELGRAEASRAAYAKLLGKPGGDDAVARYRIGEAHAAAGKTGAALAAWRELALAIPAHPLADRALERARALDAAPLTPRERITRAAALTSGRDWPRALEELNHVGDSEPADVLRLRDFWTGNTLFKMRRQYGKAGELLLSVYEQMGSLAPYALFHGARGLSRGDRDNEAIKWYREVVRRYPQSEWAAEAQFLSGWLEYNRGEFRACIPGLRGLLDRYANSKFADDALWYLGYAHYLLGEHDEALALLTRLARQGGELTGGKGRYWKARTLGALKRTDEATAELRELVGVYPLSWYAMLARTRLLEQGIVLGPFGDGASAGRGDAPAFATAIDAKVAADPLIQRVDELTAAGMVVEAGVELERGERPFVAKYGAARALPVVFDRYRRAGNFNRPYALAEAYGGRALRLSPAGDEGKGARVWWEHAYPRAYREWVDKYAQLGKNPPLYLYAIMRKESGYDPHVASYADALGLMQMIPPTTIRVAAALGIPYTDDLLFDPEINVKVGSWYIGSLAHKFRLQIPIASGSYNGGPRPMMKWLDKYGDRPIDEFVELISFTQTREYMKKVTSIYARYLLLYAGEDYQQPLALDPKYLKNDINY